MRKWSLTTWLRRSLIVEGLNSLAGFLGLGNPIGAIATLAGALIMGWWTAWQTWAGDSLLKSYGTAGYVVTILVVTILILLSALLATALWRVLTSIVTKNNRGLNYSQDTAMVSTDAAAIAGLRERSFALTEMAKNTMKHVSLLESLTERLYHIEHARQLARRLEKAKRSLIAARTQTLNRKPDEIDKYTLDSALQLERDAMTLLASEGLMSMKDLRYELKIAEERAYGEAAKDREANPGRESHVTAHKQHVAELRRLEDLMEDNMRKSRERADVDLPGWEQAITPPPAAPSDTPSPADTVQRTRR